MVEEIKAEPQKETKVFDPVDKTVLEVAQEIPVEERQEARVEDLWGTFLRVTSVPTHTPKRFAESIALDESEDIIYYYDFANNQWRTISEPSVTMYRGKVDETGTGDLLPTGWTSEKTATGKYKVTHNLGHNNYAVAITPLGTLLHYLDPAPDSTAFYYATITVGATFIDSDAHFIV